MENECIRIIYKGNMLIGDFVNPVKVSIDLPPYRDNRKPLINWIYGNLQGYIGISA